MQHPDEGTIHTWLDGALSADEAARVEAHVNECPQCQAAVAEARGFIAASSRILTALDNAPRGVVPTATATPQKRDRMVAFRPADRWVWRIAATVLVVAAGTLVVVRKTGVSTSASTAPATVASRNESPAKTGMAGADLAQKTAPAPSPSAAAIPPIRRPEPELSRIAPRTQSEITLNHPLQAGAAGLAESSAGREQSQRNAVIPESNPGLAQRGARADAPTPVPPRAAAAPQSFGAVSGSAAPAMAAGAADMVVAANEPGVRVAGTRRTIGQNITRYEVVPGDTVELAEIIPVQLDQVVVTRMGTTRSATGQARAASPPRASAKAGVSAADTSAAVTATLSSSGVTTIAWKDATGRTLRLSGRHTPAELQAIRQTIERLRATAAADSASKNR